MANTFDQIRALLEKNSGANNNRTEENLMIQIFNLLGLGSYTWGWADYNHDGSALTLTADTFTDIPNNGEGAQTREDFLPAGMPTLLNPISGKFILNELPVGSFIIWRFDMRVTTSQNNELIELHNSWAQGGSFPFENGTVPPVQLKSTGTPAIITGFSGGFIGSDDIRTNPMNMRIKVTGPTTTLLNTGMWVVVAVKNS